MRNLKRIITVVLPLLILGCPTIDRTEKVATPPISRQFDILKDVKRIKLDNGLSLIIKKESSLPIVCVMIWYRVGSVCETPEVVGISHIIEHMMFKGTEKFGKGSIDLFTYRNGGYNNAYTSNDFTTYFFVLEKSAWKGAIEILADWMLNCKFDPKELEAEKKVVLEELKNNLDTPYDGEDIFREIEKLVFTQHPYRNPILGFEETIKGLDRNRILEFYKRYYNPANATIVLVGDIDENNVASYVKTLFGKIPPSEPTEDISVEEPSQFEERRSEITAPLACDRLRIGFRTSKVGSGNDYALELIARILGDGKGSRLYKKLVEEARVARSVYILNYLRRYDGVFYINCDLNPGAKTDTTEKIMYQEINNLKKVSPRELQRAKNRITADFFFRRESIFDTAYFFGYYETVVGLDYLRAYLAKIDNVTLDDIRKTVETVFKPENRTVVISKGTSKVDRKNGTNRYPSDDFKKEVLIPRLDGLSNIALPGIGSDEIWHVRLKNGLNIIILKKPDSAITAIKAFVNAGSIYDPDGKSGLANITGKLLSEGTQDITGRKRTADEITSAIEFVGGKLETGATGVNIKVLGRDTNLALDLLKDILIYPSFPKEKLDLIKGLTLSQIQAEDDKPYIVAEKLFLKNVYGEHPLSNPKIGMESTVKILTREDCVDYHKKYYIPQNTTIAIVGDFNPRRIINAVEARFAEWAPGETLIEVPEPKRLKEPKTIYKRMDTQQLNIFIGHLGVRRTNADFYALQVLDLILGSSPVFTDRLTKKLREEEGLAYDLYGCITRNADIYPGTFTAYISTSPQNGIHARESIFREIEKLKEQGITDEELNDAKAFLTKSLALKFEKVEDLADYLISILRFNLGMDYPQRFKSLLEKLTKDDIIKVARNYLDTNNYVLVVVGPVDDKGNPILPEPKTPARDEKQPK